MYTHRVLQWLITEKAGLRKKHWFNKKLEWRYFATQCTTYSQIRVLLKSFGSELQSLYMHYHLHYCTTFITAPRSLLHHLHYCTTFITAPLSLLQYYHHHTCTTFHTSVLPSPHPHYHHRTRTNITIPALSSPYLHYDLHLCTAITLPTMQAPASLSRGNFLLHTKLVVFNSISWNSNSSSFLLVIYIGIRMRCGRWWEFMA